MNTPRPTHPPARVLIVDDERSIRHWLRVALQTEGYETDTAENAAQAQALLPLHRWDVVVADIGLPDLSGLELLKKIHAAVPDVQVIMITGAPDVKTAAEAVRAGAQDYLVKPVSLEAIRRSVAHAVQIKFNNDARRRMQEELRTAKEAAEAANRAKSTFLANINHELRTPLTAILGFSEMLQEKHFGPLTPKQEEYVNDIVDSGRHLLSLVNDLLDMAKIEADRMDLHPSEFALSPLLDHSLMMVQERCMQRSIRLTLDLPEGIRAMTVTADERMLKQVLFNLLSNAAKFTPNGGQICVSANLFAECGTQNADSGKNPQTAIEISVSDTGMGIAREHQAIIFDAFRQVQNHMMGNASGTGLGLWLSRRLVELHGGRIWVESEGEGKGSTFRFTLPVSTGVLQTSPGSCILDTGRDEP
jgi:signal transduction histidine kinase